MSKKLRGKNKKEDKKPIVLPDENATDKVSIPKKTKRNLIIVFVLLVILIIGGLWYYGTHSTLERSDKTISKKEKATEKKKDTIVEEAKENNTEIAYYDDVKDYLDSMKDKNGSLTFEEKQTLVDKEYGDGVYVKYVRGLLPSKRLTPSEIEQMILLGRGMDKDLSIGYVYKDLRINKDGTIDKDDILYSVVGDANYYLPTTDGFQEVGDGSYVGYPYLSKLTTNKGNYLLLNALVYFDKDMTLKDLSNYRVNLKLSNNNSEDFKTAVDLDKVNEEISEDEDLSFENNPYDLFENFGIAVLDDNTSLFSKVYGTTVQNNNIKVAKGGILTYSVIVDIDTDDIDKLNEKLDVYIGDTKTSITKSSETEDVEFKVVK